MKFIRVTLKLWSTKYFFYRKSWIRQKWMTNSKIGFYKKANTNLFRFLLISSYSGKFECPLVQIEGRVFIQYFNVEFKLQNTLQLHWNDITSQLWNCPSGMEILFRIELLIIYAILLHVTMFQTYHIWMNICPHIQMAIPMKRYMWNKEKTFIYI